MLDANPLQARLNPPLLWCHLPPVISSPLISSGRGSAQVLDEGFCLQEGTKSQPQPCVLEGLVPRPPRFSLGHEPWHKSLAFARALSSERATWHVPGDFSFFIPTALSVEMLSPVLGLAEELLFQPSGIVCSPCPYCLWSDAIKKPGPVASVVLYLIPAVLQVLSMQASESSSRPWQLSCP